MFVSKYTVLLKKEFLLKDNESKVELEEVQDAQADANHEITGNLYSNHYKNMILQCSEM